MQKNTTKESTAPPPAGSENEPEDIWFDQQLADARREGAQQMLERAIAAVPTEDEMTLNDINNGFAFRTKTLQALSQLSIEEPNK